NFNDMYIVSINDNNEIVFDNEALQNLRINYNTFIEGISISFPNFILLEDFIQDQVLDATDNLCYTTIIGKKKYDKRIKLLAELKGDNLINDDEFKELFNLATNELNEKNPGLNYPLME
ncbi:MAG TPA: hypothetical protein PKX15_11115, partial [Bacteroidales bacterium]|nr:hypothetical protein [Bacteroidales bacterium]